MAIYATAAGGQTEGSDLVNINETPDVRDKVRERLVKTNPDVDAHADQQTDSAAFLGKKYVVQDTKYGHYISEHDNSDSASTAEDARPYSRVIQPPELQSLPQIRDKVRKKLMTRNPDVD